MKLTLPQQDIYFEQLLYLDEPIYNIGAKIAITGALDVESLKLAYHALINQHDAFRCVIKKRKEGVYIDVLDTHNSILGFIDLSSRENPVEFANKYMQEEFKKPFDLFSEELLHVFTLLKVGKDSYYLFSVYHHIITDGWGTSLMFRRLVQNYNEIVEFGGVITEYPYLYVDFVNIDILYRNSKDFENDKKYWKGKFTQLPESLFDKIDLNLQLNKSSRKVLMIKKELYGKLIDFSSSIKATPFHLILAMLFAYFGKIRQNNDFAIGLPVLNRSSSKFKKTVGLFMGVNPLRLNFTQEYTIEELVNCIKAVLKQDYRHQRFPLGELIKELQLFNEKERLFNITLSYEKQDYSPHFFNTRTEVIPLTHQSERVALAIYIREFDKNEDVKIDFDYNLNYFTEESINKVVEHFRNILQDVLYNPFKKIKDLDFLSPNDRQKLLKEFNETNVSYPRNKTVVHLFEEQVQKTSNSTAIKDNDNSYTYLETKEITDVIADNLLERLGDSIEPVGVIMNRSSKLIFFLTGILKSGKSFIPIDPNLPEKRIDYIIKNSRIKAIITDVRNSKKDGIEFIDVQEIGRNISNNNLTSKYPKVQETAYVIYTSGSTGNPKGVEISHQALTNLLISIQNKPMVNATDLFYSVTTYSFDISILEFFVPLISGATLFIAKQETLFEPRKIIKELEMIKPTIIQATPSFYQMLYSSNWKGDGKLKVLCGGDLLSEALVDKLIYSTKEVWNMYGPTETTIWSSLKKVEKPQDASNIGKPINNTQFYILDRSLKLLPIGTIGRIFIGGNGLAKGYYQNKELTSQKFINNPFIAGEKIYETGDMGRWTVNGEIEFLGRNDNQVKVRGYRIELGEIEAHINDYLQVNNSVVLVKKSDFQESMLISFIPKLSTTFKIEKMKTQLKKSLPDYMIPGIFIELDDFPLTPNQKIDRNALSLIATNNFNNKKTIKKASTPTELKVQVIWEEVLKISNEIGVDESFFSLGGNSLLAVKLIAKLEEVFLLEISMKKIFQNSTIQLLSSYIEKIKEQEVGNISKIKKVGFKEFYQLTPGQQNIWIASQNEKLSIAYNMFSAFDIIGTIDLDALEQAFIRLISNYEILQTNFVEIGGIPYQKLNLKLHAKFEFLRISLENESDLNNVISEFSNQVFDLQRDILLKVGMVKIGNREILLFLTHHIILDGLSIGIMIKEILNFYSNTNKISEEPMPLQFKDYSEWIINSIETNAVKNTKFWKNYLLNFKKEELIFNSGFRPQTPSFNGQKLSFELNDVTLNKLKAFAVENETTVFITLVAVFNLFLYKFSNEEDICIGVVLNGRSIKKSQPKIGMFAKTLPFRTKISPDYNFAELLKTVETTFLEIENHQDLPNGLNLGQLFDILFVYQNYEFSIYEEFDFDQASLKMIPQKTIKSRIPIAINLNECSSKIICEIDFNNELYDEEIIKVVWKKYAILIEQIIVDTNKYLVKYDILLPNEKSIENNIDIEFDF